MGDRGRERDREGRDREEGREDSFRSERDNNREGRENSFRSERDNKDRESRDRYRRDDRSEAREGKTRPSEEPGELGGGKEVLSLSIEESNKLRAKLGLKPLNISNIVVEEDDSDMPGELIPGDRDKTRHLVPQHWGERDHQKKLVEKLGLKRDQRRVRSKLAFVKGLGDSDSEDDAAEKWVERQKKKVKEKEEAEKRAKVMEELDQEFGVQEIVEEGLKEKQQKEYSGNDLKGMRVEHSAEAFGETTTVLTLQDADILSDKYEDVLVNVNIEDDERHKKSMANIKAGKLGYQAYDQEEVDELTGEVTKKDLLYQYQEELEGVREEEKAINRALNNGPGQPSPERSTSPAPSSRIPKFSSGLGVNYKRVQEKIEKATNDQHVKRRIMSGKRHKLSKTPATSNSNLLSLTKSVVIPQGSRLLQPEYALQKCRSDPNILRSRSRSRIAKFKSGTEQF